MDDACYKCGALRRIGEKCKDGCPLKFRQKDLWNKLPTRSAFTTKKAIDLNINDDVVNLGRVRGVQLVRGNKKTGELTDKVCIKFSGENNSNSVVVSKKELIRIYLKIKFDSKM